MAGAKATNSEMMKSYIWLQTSDGSIEQVEQDVALFCPLICHKVCDGIGFSKTDPVHLPDRVDSIILRVVLDFCRFHCLRGHSNLEMKRFNERFINANSKKLCELTVAAEMLQLSPLADLTSNSLKKFIERSTDEEIRQTFGLPDDITEEDKWKPITIGTNDPQVRLLNILAERKRKELKEKLKNVSVEAPCVDDRSIDELMSFINGENEGRKEKKPSKKNHKGKDKQNSSS